MPALLSDSRLRCREFVLRRNQQQAPVAAETQRRVMRLRMSPTTGLSFDLMRQPSAVQSAAPNIRRREAMVNEMGIQFCLSDTLAVLSRMQKANGTTCPSMMATLPRLMTRPFDRSTEKSAHADPVLAPAKISKTTPCKVAVGRGHGCFSLQKHFDTSGKSPALLQHRANFDRSWPCQTGCPARSGQTFRPLKLNRLATVNDRLRVAEPRALATRVPEENST
jgi:hypothetical protein